MRAPVLGSGLLLFCFGPPVVLLTGSLKAVASPQTVSQGPDQLADFVVMETADVSSTIDTQKLSLSLKLTSAELGVGERDLPTITVFHLSRADAAKLHLSEDFAGISGSGSSLRYEMWLIGEPSDYVYSRFAENIIEHHFDLKVNNAERARIVQSVCSRLKATVSVTGFQRRGSSGCVSPPPPSSGAARHAEN
jgi:hypothetical protein